MKTMLDLAIEFLSENKDQDYEFDQIFNHVEENLKSSWEANFVSDRNNYEQVRTKKLGELYRLLTVDGSFIRTHEGLWQLNQQKFN
ncbi:DNA-directed RNA polymerase subunit delta [Mycoplasma crocodyli]|uniref:HTH HARE-type domain-containing protein n=1 Tax=Mycoplasma crocodyli (strain ATCC 51981 / MP145) TaxID=512564 RepID=D5E626_MYCCM|nr:hypothetical protein [Mycoplasma crocodyli]ADE19754.1 conserved hypothetical protein [Mycoplasma crocodyli MP145]